MSDDVHTGGSEHVDWPGALPRTESHKRKECPSGFQVTLSRSFQDILDELRKWPGVTDVQLEFGAEAQKTNPNKPYANATFDDPSVLVRFQKDGEDMAAGCDKWTKARDNARDLYHYLHETRMQEQRGTVTAESEYRKLRLPSGEAHAVVDPYAVLGVDRDASEEEIAKKARERLAEEHPDVGGDVTEFKRIKEARKELIG